MMKSGFYCTNLKQNESIKLLKVLFKHIFTINGPNMAIMMSIFFPIIVPILPKLQTCVGNGMSKGARKRAAEMWIEN